MNLFKQYVLGKKYHKAQLKTLRTHVFDVFEDEDNDEITEEQYMEIVEFRNELRVYAETMNCLFSVTFIAGKFSHSDTFVNELFNEFNNQAGTNKVIFSKLTGLIPLHFDDCLPFSMFTIADINKINSADLNQTLEKFDQKCFAETHIWLAYPRNTALHNPDHTLLSN